MHFFLELITAHLKWSELFQKIIEDENNGLESMNLRISSHDIQMEATDNASQEYSVEVIESMRASLLESNVPNGSFFYFCCDLIVISL